MDTLTVGPDLAQDLEFAEVRAWLDLLACVPKSFADEFGLTVERVGDAVVLCARGILCPLLNRALGVGLESPANERLLDRILELGRRAPGKFLIHLVPTARPRELPDLLADRGLYPRGSWDRLYRDAAPLPDARQDGSPEESEAPQRAEAVGGDAAEEWAGFVCQTHELPCSKPCLRELVGRPGWHHFVVRTAGAISAARSMFVQRGGIAWLGLDASTSRSAAPGFDEDRELCRALVERGRQDGAQGFVAEIQAAKSSADSPPYERFSQLGFARAYRRTNFAR